MIKIGTNVIMRSNGDIDLVRMNSLIFQVNLLKRAGKNVLIVTSGAVGAGMAKLHLREKPDKITLKQVCAAIGQSSLIHHYETRFRKYGHTVAQVLLNREDLIKDYTRISLNEVLGSLLEMGVIPIINENDVISNEELIPIEQNVGWLDFSDNDGLAAALAIETKADLLILLTDVDGLFDDYPITKTSTRITQVERIDGKVLALAKRKGGFGRGGMRSKINAAKNATDNGILVVIANGQKKNIITEVMCGYNRGTLFIPIPCIRQQRGKNLKVGK